MTDGRPDEELHVFVRGRVQGVFFRQATEDEALRLGLRGWVRNLPDGKTVEVLAQGNKEGLQELLDFLHQGPPGADVRQVEPEWKPRGQPLSTFHVSG